MKTALEDDLCVISERNAKGADVHAEMERGCRSENRHRVERRKMGEKETSNGGSIRIMCPRDCSR